MASPSCELPIEFREGLLWMEVRVPQSKESLHFLVDSGASASVVNLDTARRLSLKLGPKVSVAAVATTMTGLRIGNHQVDTVPTGLHSRAIFPGESGLLGDGLLAQFGVVTIDAKAGRLILGPVALY